MADFSTIYVDLAKTEAAPSSVLDGDGAVICDSTTEYGTDVLQLTFAEFQKYLTVRCDGRTVAFLLKNSITITTLIDSTLFYVNTKSTITIENQIDDTSYKIGVNVPASTIINIHAFNSSLVINNMDLDIMNKGLLQINGVDSSTANNDHNAVYLNNCRIWITDPEGFRTNQSFSASINSAVVFNKLRLVKCYGCIFNSKSIDTNTAIIMVQPTKGYGSATYTSDSTPLVHEFISCVFVRVYNLYTQFSTYNSRFFEVLAYNVLTGSKGVYRDTPPTRALKNFSQLADLAGPFPNEYAWSTVPTVCDAPLLTATNSDFDHLDTDWDTIDYTYVDTLTEDALVFLNNILSYGQRDGVGSLWFNPMTPPVASIVPTTITYGDSTTLKNSDATYDTVFEPSKYIWGVDSVETDTTSPLGEIYVTVNHYGVVSITMQVVSHNSFYVINGSGGQIRSVVVSNDINFLIDTYDSTNTPTDTFVVDEEITIVITNDTDVSDDIIRNVEVRVDNRRYGITSSVDAYLDTWDTTIKLDTVGDEHIVCIVETIDGVTHYFTKDLTITANTGTTYYVDLSTDYGDDKWLTMKNGIYDDFEDGSISTSFNQSFVNDYSVVDMYDEKVATGISKSTIITGIIDGDYSVEWSFVRDSEDDRPQFIIDVDGVELDIEWDFISDKINLRYDGDKNSIIYGSFIKDLDCPNTLHKIYFKVVYDSSLEITVFSYSLDNGETYVNSVIDTHSQFTNMSVKTQCDTGSGLGYVGIQAENADQTSFKGDGKGSEEYPFTYEEMYDRIRDGGTGEKYDRYMCRNMRIVNGNIFSRFSIDNDKQFHIDVWNPHKYGPWVLVFNRFRRDIEMGGTTLSNGIIYNTPRGGSSSHLTVTTMYDMLVTWNGSRNKIGFIRAKNQYSKDDYRSDIIGCTIKSEGGFYSDNIARGDG